MSVTLDQFLMWGNSGVSNYESTITVTPNDSNNIQLNPGNNSTAGQGLWQQLQEPIYTYTSPIHSFTISNKMSYDDKMSFKDRFPNYYNFLNRNYKYNDIILAIKNSRPNSKKLLYNAVFLNKGFYVTSINTLFATFDIYNSLFTSHNLIDYIVYNYTDEEQRMFAIFAWALLKKRTC